MKTNKPYNLRKIFSLLFTLVLIAGGLYAFPHDPLKVCGASLAMGMPVYMSDIRPAILNAVKELAPPVSREHPANLLLNHTDLLYTNKKDFDNANKEFMPEHFSVRITSDSTAGVSGTGVATRIYLFNQDYLDNIVGNGRLDGSGNPVGITYQWQDGRSGSSISRGLRRARAMKGKEIFGYSIRTVKRADQTASPTSLGIASPTWYYEDLVGNKVPYSDNIVNPFPTRADQDFSLGVVTCLNNVNEGCQFSFVQDVDVITEIIFHTIPFQS